MRKREEGGRGERGDRRVRYVEGRGSGVNFSYKWGCLIFSFELLELFFCFFKFLVKFISFLFVLGECFVEIEVGVEFLLKFYRLG